MQDSAAHLGDEYAWQRQDIPRAVQAIEAAGFAVLGGEVWVVRRKSECGPGEPSSMLDNRDPNKNGFARVLSDRGDWVIYGLVATRDGGPLTSFTWDVRPRTDGEGWQ